MVHQSLVTRPEVPSSTVPPESHPKPDVLDVFGSRDNVVREHFQRVLGLSAPAMIAVFALYATLVDMALVFMLEALPFYSIADDAAAKAIDPRAMIADKGFWITFIAAIFLAPLLETLMNQWFPIWLAMKVTHRPVVAVWFSTVLFGAIHLQAGVYGFVATVGAGFFLAVAFLHARQFGRDRALGRGCRGGGCARRIAITDSLLDRESSCASGCSRQWDAMEELRWLKDNLSL